MPICYVLVDVPESDLEMVKDSVKVDGCKPEVERQSDGKYRVKAVCENEEQ
ncbi:hypothetical protein WNY77_13530 [Paraglaciecola mesophila]|uniref:Uncharacterized protein n=1 Tax=Paraglaciecola mesophila TaxID=197222 RepID=A0ABU9SX39_9ALTE